MDNENNNADFEETLHEVHPRLKPAPDMTREEYVEKAKGLLDELLADHEEHTGIEDNETRDWEYWTGELTSAYLNS